MTETTTGALDGVLRLATRGSALARRQTELVTEMLSAAWPQLRIEAVVMETRGDQSSEPLDRIGGQGIFVKEIQAAVLDGRADVAVHSAKDLPSQNPDALLLACVPDRADPRDALVGCRLDELGPGAIVATGSARRRSQLANLRPDLTFVELRGNMGTRVSKATDGTVAAVVVAVAAMERLGWMDQIAEILDPVVMLPQVGQGAIALECGRDDVATNEISGRHRSRLFPSSPPGRTGFSGRHGGRLLGAGRGLRHRCCGPRRCDRALGSHGHWRWPSLDSNDRPRC